MIYEIKLGLSTLSNAFFSILSKVQACLKGGGQGGRTPPRFWPRPYCAPPDFWPRPLLLAPPDFQTLRHACIRRNRYQISLVYKPQSYKHPTI